MRRRQRPCHIDRDRDDPVLFQRVTGQQTVQTLALDQFHDQVRAALCMPHLVDSSQPWMRKTGQPGCLTPK